MSKPIGSVRLNLRQSQAASRKTQNILRWGGIGTATTLAAVATYCLCRRPFAAPANHQEYHPKDIGQNSNGRGNHEAVLYKGSKKEMGLPLGRRNNKPLAQTSQSVAHKMPSDQRRNNHYNYDPKAEKSAHHQGKHISPSHQKTSKIQQPSFHAQNGTVIDNKNHTREERKVAQAPGRAKQPSEPSKKVNLTNIDPSYVVVSNTQPGAKNLQRTNAPKAGASSQDHALRKRDIQHFGAPIDAAAMGDVAAFPFNLEFGERQKTSPASSGQLSGVREINVRIPKERLSGQQLNQLISGFSGFTINSSTSTPLNSSRSTLPETEKYRMAGILKKLANGNDGKPHLSSANLRAIKHLADNIQVSITDIFRYAAGLDQAELTGRDIDTFSPEELDNLLGKFVESVFFRPGFIAEMQSEALNNGLTFAEIKNRVSEECTEFPHLMLGQFAVSQHLSKSLHQALTDGILSGISPLFLRSDIDEISPDLRLESIDHLIVELGGKINPSRQIDAQKETTRAKDLYSHGVSVLENWNYPILSSSNEENPIQENHVLLNQIKNNMTDTALDSVVSEINKKFIEQQLEINNDVKNIINNSTTEVKKLYDGFPSVEKVAKDRLRKAGIDPEMQVNYTITEERDTLNTLGQSDGAFISASSPQEVRGPAFEAHIQGVGNSITQSGVKLKIMKDSPLGKAGENVYFTQDGLREDFIKEINDQLTQVKETLPNQQNQVVLDIGEKIGGPLKGRYFIQNYRPDQQQLEVLEYEKLGASQYIALKLDQGIITDYRRITAEQFQDVNGAREDGTPLFTEQKGSQEELLEARLEPLKRNLEKLETEVGKTKHAAHKNFRSGRQLWETQLRKALPESINLAINIANEEGPNDLSEWFFQGIQAGLEIATLGRVTTGTGSRLYQGWKNRQNRGFPQPALNQGNILGSIDGQRIPQAGRRNNGVRQQGDSGEYASIDTPPTGRRNNGVRQQQKDSRAYTQENFASTELRNTASLIGEGDNGEVRRQGNFVYKIPKLGGEWTENEHPLRVANLWNEFYTKAYNGKYAYLANAEVVKFTDGVIGLKTSYVAGKQASKAQQRMLNEELRRVLNREMLDVDAKGNVLVDERTGDSLSIDFGHVRRLTPPYSPVSRRLERMRGRLAGAGRRP